MMPSRSELLGIWQKRGKKNLFIALGVTGCLAIGALGSTLAANINLNGGETVEFGQGIAQTTACSGDNSLTITPYSTFVNEVGAGAHYFTSLTVSDIPLSCLGAVFTITAEGENDELVWSNCTSPGPVLSLRFTETGTVPTEYSWENMYSTVLESNSNSFTVTWVDPLEDCESSILADDVRAITIQSSGSATGFAGYVADYTTGTTSFNSQPLVSIDALINFPVDNYWINEGSLAPSGDLTISSVPNTYDSGQANPYVSLVDKQVTGDLGALSADRVTVEMWLNFDENGGDFNGRLFSFETNDSRECGYGLFLDNGDIGINTCRNDILGFSIADITNEWHHLVWVASSGARYTQKIYVDGVLQNLTFRGPNDTFLENPRTNIGTGQFGLNSWNTTEMYVGALKIYEGEMPLSTIQSKAAAFQARLP